MAYIRAQSPDMIVRHPFARFVLTVFFVSGLSSLHAQIADSNSRRVNLAGAVNFRDIGGYPTSEGKKVTWGHIYRGPALGRLTEGDRAELYDRRITTIIDFRSEDEAGSLPDTVWQDCKYQRNGAGSEKLSGWAPLLKQLHTGDSLLKSFYGDLDSLGPRYRPLFQKLLTQGKREAVVYHCSSGKDRTGIATALILHTLGVSDDLIMQDYLASNYYRQRENERSVKILTLNGIEKAVAEDLVMVKPEYIKTTFDAINEKYGNLDAFLQQVMGIGPAEVKLLREKYTK